MCVRLAVIHFANRICIGKYWKFISFYFCFCRDQLFVVFFLFCEIHSVLRLPSLFFLISQCVVIVHMFIRIWFSTEFYHGEQCFYTVEQRRRKKICSNLQCSWQFIWIKIPWNLDIYHQEDFNKTAYNIFGKRNGSVAFVHG